MRPLVTGYAPPGTRLLLVSMYLATVPMGYLVVVLPLYLARAGLEPPFIGLLYTVSGIVSAALVAFSGVFADRWGRRRFLLTGTLLPIPSYLILAAATVPEERATAVGAGFAVWGLANAAGPLAAGWLLAAGVFGLPLIIGAAMYIAGGVVFGVGFTRIQRRDAAAATVVAA